MLEAVAYNQVECFEAGVLFARNEGIVPAPEANHAVKGAIDRGVALQAGGQGRNDPVQPLRPRPLRHVGLSKYFAGELSDEKYDEAELAMALAGLPSVPA